jgi:hypothetical protein
LELTSAPRQQQAVQVTSDFNTSLDDAPTEGKFILSESTNGDTAAIDYNASAAAVDSAIDAVVGYSVGGSAGGPWTCESDAQEEYSRVLTIRVRRSAIPTWLISGCSPCGTS